MGERNLARGGGGPRRAKLKFSWGALWQTHSQGPCGAPATPRLPRTKLCESKRRAPLKVKGGPLAPIPCSAAPGARK